MINGGNTADSRFHIVDAIRPMTDTIVDMIGRTWFSTAITTGIACCPNCKSPEMIFDMYGVIAVNAFVLRFVKAVVNGSIFSPNAACASVKSDVAFLAAMIDSLFSR